MSTTDRAVILIVEDEATVRRLWKDMFDDTWPDKVLIHEAVSFAQVQGLCRDKTFRPDIAVIDHRLSGERRGHFVAQLLREKYHGIHILVATQYADDTNADGTLEQELYPTGCKYFDKGGDKWIDDTCKGDITQMISEVLNELTPEMKSLMSDLTAISPRMKEIVKDIVKHASHEAPILILGESGVGKEEIARVIHRMSPRKSEPFASVNCGAIPNELFEREMFGLDSAAGVAGQRPGVGAAGHIESAAKGTLFLDEIGDLSLENQVKLLRVTQGAPFTRIGGTMQISPNVRWMAATNKDLWKEKEEKKFREDLYYRIAVVQIAVPALRDRCEEIIPLAQNYLDKKYRGFYLGKAYKRLLEHYGWPGNVRELINELDHAVSKSESKQLGPHLFLGGPSRANIGSKADTRPSPRLAGLPTTAQQDWRTGLDMNQVCEMACQIWTSKGQAIGNDPDSILHQNGAPFLRAVLALLRRAVRRHCARTQWTVKFDELFGFGSGKRKSMGLSQYLQNISRQKEYKAYFTPRPGRKQFGAQDLDDDAAAMEQDGFQLDLD